MQKLLDIGSKLFFDILIVCLISSIYFNVLPQNNITSSISTIFCIFYFGVNFYSGFKNNLTLKEAIIIGVIGCGIGLFLGLFSLYTNFILHNSRYAISIIKPYFIPTWPIMKMFLGEITIAYPFILMVINIALVIFGSISKNILNKLLS
ncbi:MAG: hypothetical protein RRZ84_06465 [Romboutsia sp.]